MRIRPILLSLCLLCAGCGSSFHDEASTPTASVQAWTPPDPASLSVDLQRHVDRALADNHFPGAIVGVWTPAGVWTSATGLADVTAQRPMTLDDSGAFRSITKSFTVTVILQLAEEGLVDLDGPVSRYVDGVPNGDVMTIRQLANMTSGLFSYTKDPEFWAQLSQDLTREWTIPEVLAFPYSHPVNFPAGTEYEYSDSNTLVLGEVAEAATGTPIDELIATRLLRPLGLDHTTYVHGTQLPAPFARGYIYDAASGSFVEQVASHSALGAAGAMAGTLEDLHQWGRALVLGTEVSPALQAQRFVSRPATNGPIYDTYGVGMGEVDGWWGHSGEGLGYQAGIFTDPRTGSSIAILLNGTGANEDVPVGLVREIQKTLGWRR